MAHRKNKKRFPKISKNFPAVFGAIFFFAISSAMPQEWLNQTFDAYTPGATATLNTSLSPQLITNSSYTLYTTITNDSGKNMARYKKATTSGGSQVLFALSPTNAMTARTCGYVSFKVKQNIDASISTGNSFDVGIGNNNPAISTSGAADRLIGISFFQSTGANNIQIKSGTNTITNNSFTTSTTYPKVQIWFNDSDTIPMAYTDPSGVSRNLSTNSFVVYLGTSLLTP